MRLNFLAAGVPLTKTFSRLPNGTIEKSAYPHVKNFSSAEVNVEDIDQFHAAVTAAAKQGLCLLKGKLTRKLSDESRAGSTNSVEPTEWSCFDLDGIPGIANAEEFITNVLPSEFHDVDYVLQWSASSGIVNHDIRCHIFFMHSAPFSPETAKLWLTDVNLSNPLLSSQLQLTASGMALKFSLDRTVMQNDKLIYIAPPILSEDIDDPLKERILLVRKEHRLCNFDFSLPRNASAIDAAAHEKVDELRRAAGLRRRRPNYRVLESGERLLLNPEIAMVTGEKRDRDYIRLNLNGGDSWAYYYHASNPKYLYNFKGEPIVILADFCPQYWQDIQPRLREENKGLRPFAFRQLATDTLYNGIYDPVNDRITEIAATSGGKKLKDFFSQFDIEQDENLDWTYEFRPWSTTVIDFEQKFCNKWQPTDFQRMKGQHATVPPTIDRVLWSVLGDDRECYDHFLNWLACIWQTRQKMATAWILQGVQGTGKGVLFHHILVPLFGEKYCVTKQLRDFDDKFNAELETCLLFNIDEVKLSSQTNSSRTLNQLKSLITEPVINMRAMRQNAVQVRNYTNFILTSNDYDVMAIDEYDRRFNVAPRQEQRLWLEADDIERISAELSQFAGFLNAYVIDVSKGRTCLDNDAKQEMRLHSMDSIEQLAYAFHTGNLEFFLQFVDNPPASDLNNIGSTQLFHNVCHVMCSHVDKPLVMPRAQIETIYKYLVGIGKFTGSQTFAKLMSHKHILVHGKYEVEGQKAFGVEVVWKGSPEDVERWLKLTEPKTTPRFADPKIALLKTAP